MRAFCQDQQHGTPGKIFDFEGVVERGNSEAIGGQIITATARPERLSEAKEQRQAVIMRREQSERRVRIICHGTPGAIKRSERAEAGK